VSQESDRDLSALYRAGAVEEPPPRLDRFVEAAARRELRPSRLRSFFDALPRWRLAVGAFAVVTLSVSLVTLMKEEAPSVLDPAASVTPPAEPRPSDREVQPPSEVPRPEYAERARVREQISGPPGRAAEAVGQEARQERTDRRALPEPARTEAAPAAKPDMEDVSKKAEAQPPAAPAPSSEIAAAPPAASAPSPSASRNEEIRQRSNAGDATAFGRLARKEGEATGTIAKEASPQTRASPPARAAASPSVAEESPQAWVKRLSEWLAQGREQEVRHELERFRQRYPDFVLPEDLRRLLAQAPTPRRPEDANDREFGRSAP